MKNLIYYRIFGYITTILVHVTNIVYMNSFLQGDVMDDPLIKQYAGAQTRFVTVWTFVLQIVYAVLALACDYLLLKNSYKENYKLPRQLRGVRDALFDAILWPSSWVVFSFFWTLFLYNRDLILPGYVDKVLTRTSNHIIHTFIVPVVMWEVYFRAKAEPRSHKRNLVHLALHIQLYTIVMVYTYYENNFWVYPVMARLYGTIYFPILIVFITALSFFFYFVLWWVRRIIWGNVEYEKVMKTSKKIR